MPEQNIRKPVKHFFVKKSMQISIILKILSMVILSAVFTTAILAYIYNIKSKGGSFYYMSNNIMEDLQLQSILGIILPAVIAAQIVSLLIVAYIGLFSSRKAAVPVYKIEQWANHLKNGRLNTHLAFRETREMKELTIQCNAVADMFRQTLSDIETSVNVIGAEPGRTVKTDFEIEKIRGILGKYDLGRT